MSGMLTFQEYREFLFQRGGYQRNSSGKKIHRAYFYHCEYMRICDRYKD